MDVTARVRDRIDAELDARKSRITDALDEVAERVRRLGEPLREPPYGAIGEYVESAADRIERVATDLRGRNIEQLARDVQALARRRPGVFIGAGLVAGIVAGRFLKSSGRR